MPQANIANIQVGVTTNATTSIPKQIQAGINAAQRLQKPYNIPVRLTGTGGKSLQSHLALGKITVEANEFERAIKAATARTISFGLAAGALYKVTQGLTALVRTSIEVEKSLKEIQVISNASSKEFAQYSKGIFEAARSTSESFKNASTAALEFARQGLSLDEQLRRTRDSLILTKVAGIDAAKSVQAITAAMNTFSNELSNSADLVDRLTNLDNAFAVSTADLAEGLSRVGNTAQEAGVSLNQTLSAITALQQRTARGGAVIGNALKSIFTRAGRPENIELLNNLGIATEKANGQSRDAISVLTDLAQKYKTLGDAQKRQISEQFAGLYQINQFQALIKDLGSNYSITGAAIDVVADSAGSANKRIEELNKSTSSLLQQSTANIVQLSSQLGSLTFDSPLKGFLQTFTANDSLLQGITEFLGRIGGESEGIGEKFAGGLLKGIGNILSGSGLIFLSVIIGKALGIGVKYAIDVSRTLVGVNQQLNQQAQLQNQINSALASASTTDYLRIKNTANLNDQLKLTLQLLRAQQSISINPITAGLYERGVRAGVGKPIIPRRAADGYTPIRQEINAIKNSPDYSGNRNARPQIINDFSIGGRKQPVVINSAEKIVPTRAIYEGYSGPDKYSILNPRQQKTMGMSVPNLVRGSSVSDSGKSFKLSTGLIIKPNQKYVFSSGATEKGYANLHNKERIISRRNGFESITEKDLLELSKRKLGEIPLLKIIDPSRTLKDFLPDHPNLQKKIYLSQAINFGKDKFQETQIAGGFTRSIDLAKEKRLRGATHADALLSLREKLGPNYFVKSKFGAAGDAVMTEKELINLYTWDHKTLKEFANSDPRARKTAVLVKQLQRYPQNFFAQAGIENPGTEYRVPVVGTRSGVKTIGIFERAALNESGDYYNFSDPMGKSIALDKKTKLSEIKAVFKRSTQSIKQIPTYLRNRFVGGLDVTPKGIYEINPTDDIGYSGALDNAEVRAKTAKVLDEAGKIDTDRATRIGKKIINIQSETARQRNFSKFNKSLLSLKQVDEIAYNQIAANLSRAGFNIEVGGKLLSSRKANNYFKKRGFAGGFIPQIKDAIARESQFISPSKIYVDTVNTSKYSGPVVANTRDEPNRASLLNAVNTRMSSGYVPNLVSQSALSFAQLKKSEFADSISSKVASGNSKFTDKETQRLERQFRLAKIKSLENISSDVEAAKRLREINREAEIGKRSSLSLKKNLEEYSKAEISSIQEQAKNNKKEINLRKKENRNIKALETNERVSQILTDKISKAGIFTLLKNPDKIIDNVLAKEGIKAKNINAARSNALQQIQQRRAGLASGVGFGAAFGLPLLAGQVESFGGKNTASRLISSGLNAAGAGASIGLIGGPKGALVGAGIGLAAGVGSTLLNEPEVKRNEELQKKLLKIEDRRSQLGNVDNIIQQTARVEDLIQSGASPEIVRDTLKSITDSKVGINDPGLLTKINSIDPNLSTEDRISKLSEIKASQEKKLKEKEIKVLAESDLEKIRDTTKILQENTMGSGSYFDFINNFQKGLFRKEINKSKITNLSLPENEERVRVQAQNLFNQSELKEGVSSNSFNLNRFSGSRENILRKNLTTESFENFQQLTKNLSPTSKIEVEKAFFEALKEHTIALEEGEKVLNQANAQVKVRSEILRKLNSSALERQYSDFKNTESRNQSLFKQGLDLQKRSPFLSSSAQALAENSLSFEKSKSDLENNQQQKFSSFIDNVTKTLSETPIFTQISGELQNFQNASPQDAAKSLELLINKINATGRDSGGVIKNELLGLKDIFDFETKISESQLRELIKQNNLTEKSIKETSEVAKRIASFGGLSSLTKGINLPSAALGNSAATFRSTRFAPVNLVGKIESDRQTSSALITAGQGQLETAEQLKSQGFSEELIKKLVDPNIIKSGQTANIRNNIFDYAKNLVSTNPLSNFTGNLSGQFDQALRNNDLSPVIAQIQRGNFTQGDNKENQTELVNKLIALNNELKKAPKIAEDQVNEALKINTEAVVKLTETMMELIGGLSSFSLGKTESGGSATEININATGDQNSEYYNKLVETLKSSLLSLNFKVSNIAKQTKVVLPPEKSPFANLNNTASIPIQ